MRRLVSLVTLALVLSLQQPGIAATDVGVVRNFGPDLTATCNLPEGVAVDPQGNVYASSLNFGATSGPANICVLDSGGSIVDVISVAPVTGGVTRLLGMLFVPGEGLYVGDIGGGRVLRIDVSTHAATTIATGFGAPNAFARDSSGNLFVSDSFPGTITKIAPGGATTVFAYPAELAPREGETPGFGANGLAFDRSEQFLYVAETSRDEIYRIAYADGALGAIELFATGVAGGPLDGADGIAFDVRGNLYVCSNQSDEIAVLSPDGDVIAEYRGTAADAFNSPASLVFRGRSVFVANLALFHGGPQKLSVFTAPYPGAP
ncbi:MAG TPA: SMP-30/gluconolactonase/LRE family protein [Candidatus Limnocylindria bacterium]|jgi:sugar lactone lactonase YvrE|nr:SMP-30/gluconolactonase/LRE family protein [Candidatus Limnocylindria bacterium]